jgi:hypothetical protein
VRFQAATNWSRSASPDHASTSIRIESGAPLTFAVVAVKRMTGPVEVGACAIESMVTVMIPSNNKPKKRILVNIEPPYGNVASILVGSRPSYEICFSHKKPQKNPQVLCRFAVELQA